MVVPPCRLAELDRKQVSLRADDKVEGQEGDALLQVHDLKALGADDGQLGLEEENVLGLRWDEEVLSRKERD